MRNRVTSIDEPIYDGEWVLNYSTTTYYSPEQMFRSPYNEYWPDYEEVYNLIGQNQFRKWM